MKSNDPWLRDFIITIILSATFAAIMYLFQDQIIGSFPNDPYYLKSYGFRLVRMIVGYSIPVIWFAKKYDLQFKDLGLRIKSNHLIVAYLGGIALYLIAAVIFLKYEIFFSDWYQRPLYATILGFVMIAIMAGITDYWTRGYILLQINEKYSKIQAIFWQNVVWYAIHFYEILLLEPYIGFIGANLLTLTLGIGGDLLALETKNIMGLILGHMVLNLCIILGSYGTIIVPF